MSSPVDFKSGLELVLQSPAVLGTLEMIVRRPKVNCREVLLEAKLDTRMGLVGDNWKARGNRRMPGGAAHPGTQITLMNSRVIAMLSPDRKRWPLAGDQLYVDLDLSLSNLPCGSCLSIGTALLEVTDQPHTSCLKFATRFGLEAHLFVNSRLRRGLRLRGINARVVQSGTIREGDLVRKVSGTLSHSTLGVGSRPLAAGVV